MYVTKMYVKQLLECESDPVDLLAFINRLYDLYVIINGDKIKVSEDLTDLDLLNLTDAEVDEIMNLFDIK